MIQTLHISNYALIDSIDITLHPGLNILTGETGAGKSTLMKCIFSERFRFCSEDDATPKPCATMRQNL